MGPKDESTRENEHRRQRVREECDGRATAGSRSAMTPEPTTQAVSSSAPMNSAKSCGRSRDFVGGAALADLVQSLLQLHAIERLEWKAREDLDATLEFAEGLPEGEPPVGLRALDCGRIFHTPMSGHRLPRPDGAGFRSGVVADGEYKVEPGRAGLPNSSQLFERMPSVGIFICLSRSSAMGWTLPLGVLPALMADKSVRDPSS